jgi:hypothetical protein
MIEKTVYEMLPFLRRSWSDYEKKGYPLGVVKGEKIEEHTLFIYNAPERRHGIVAGTFILA